MHAASAHRHAERVGWALEGAGYTLGQQQQQQAVQNGTRSRAASPLALARVPTPCLLCLSLPPQQQGACARRPRGVGVQRPNGGHQGGPGGRHARQGVQGRCTHVARVQWSAFTCVWVVWGDVDCMSTSPRTHRRTVCRGCLVAGSPREGLSLHFFLGALPRACRPACMHVCMLITPPPPYLAPAVCV